MLCSILQAILVFCEWARQKLWMRRAQTLYDNNLSSNSTISLKSLFTSGGKVEMSCKWPSHLSKNSASGQSLKKGLSEPNFQLICLLNCLHQTSEKLILNEFLSPGHPTATVHTRRRWFCDQHGPKLQCRLCPITRKWRNLMFPAQSRKNGNVLRYFCFDRLSNSSKIIIILRRKINSVVANKEFPIFFFCHWKFV